MVAGAAGRGEQQVVTGRGAGAAEDAVVEDTTMEDTKIPEVVAAGVSTAGAKAPEGSCPGA